MKARWYTVAPVPAPRQTRRDAYDPSDAVLRYRAFRDEIALRHVELPLPYAHVVFFVPMPSSWSKRKRRELALTPHTFKPDVDNLLKALVDAVYRDRDDGCVHDVRATKRWGPLTGDGGILVSSSTVDVSRGGLVLELRELHIMGRLESMELLAPTPA